MTATDIAIIVTGIGTALSAIAAIIAAILAYRVHKSQQLLSQRQLLLPLWEYMSQLTEINPNQPITPDVIKLVNTLELVALSCEGGLVDEQLIRRTFRDEFIRHYQTIKKCDILPGMTINGERLLMNNRATSTLYNKLYQEFISQDRITNHP